MKHKHHIIPRHAGGSDDPSNLIELTVEEHAEAHRILFEQYGRWEDEYAWKGLAGIIGKEELVRQMCSLGGKTWKGKKHKEETIKKMSASHIGNSYAKGIPKTEEHKKKLSDAKVKKWRVVTPQGEELIVVDLQKYCIQNNLRSSKMYSIKKTGYLHKGYFCEKIGDQ